MPGKAHAEVAGLVDFERTAVTFSQSGLGPRPCEAKTLDSVNPWKTRGMIGTQ